MFYQTPSPPPKPQQTFSLDVSAFDVEWNKPVFRAPDLPASVNVSADIPFTPLRVTEIHKSK
jgi:hypothetical protein